MGYNPANVKVGHATVFIQPWISGSPATLPADTVALGTPWGGAWADLGGTDQGFRVKVSTKTSEITIEEQSTPVDILADGKTITVSGTLAEDTMQVMRWSYGGGVLTTTAAGTGQIGKTELTLQDDLDKWAIGIEVKNKDGYFRRILVPKVIITSDVETAYRRAAEKRMYPFEAVSINAPSEFLIRDMTAPAS